MKPHVDHLREVRENLAHVPAHVLNFVLQKLQTFELVIGHIRSNLLQNQLPCESSMTSRRHLAHLGHWFSYFGKKKKGDRHYIRSRPPTFAEASRRQRRLSNALRSKDRRFAAKLLRHMEAKVGIEPTSTAIFRAAFEMPTIR